MENYTSDSSGSDCDNSNKVIDLAYLLLDQQSVEENFDKTIEENRRKSTTTTIEIESIILHHNKLTTLPTNLKYFTTIRTLDISNNGLQQLPDLFKYLRCLTTLIAKNNQLYDDSLPKTFTPSPTLRELNFSGNQLQNFPEQIFDFRQLKYLYLGGNRISNIPKTVWKLSGLQILSMGGNRLTQIPSTVGNLKYLQALVLCDNHIETLPSNIADLHNLKSLLLHKNRLRTLPPAIVALKHLTELSLRDNPLVVRFISNITHTPPSLLELSARIIKLYAIKINDGDIPRTLINYLNSAHHCVNPNCKGVYFDNRVEHVKFVDFCGKYRLPLLHYLCSARCANDNTNNSNVDEDLRPYLLKKVLLG